MQECMNEGAGTMPICRVNDHPCLFINNYQVAVFINDVNGNILGKNIHGRRTKHPAFDRVICCDAMRNPVHGASINRHTTFLYSSLNLCPGRILNVFGQKYIDARIFLITGRDLNREDDFFFVGLRGHYFLYFSTFPVH